MNSNDLQNIKFNRLSQPEKIIFSCCSKIYNVNKDPKYPDVIFYLDINQESLIEYNETYDMYFYCSSTINLLQPYLFIHNDIIYNTTKKYLNRIK